MNKIRVGKNIKTGADFVIVNNITSGKEYEILEIKKEGFRGDIVIIKNDTGAFHRIGLKKYFELEYGCGLISDFEFEEWELV